MRLSLLSYWEIYMTENNSEQRQQSSQDLSQIQAKATFESAMRNVVYDAAVLTQPGGIVRDIAEAKTLPSLGSELDSELISKAAALLIMYGVIIGKPKKGEPAATRADLVGNVNQEVRDIVTARNDEVMTAAATLGMVRTDKTEDYESIDQRHALFIVEGGANKSSIVRRGVANLAIKQIYGDKAGKVVMTQFGSSRVVSPTRADGSVNPEHGTVRDLAGEFLPTSTFTEFDANLATALADGYEIKYIAPQELSEKIGQLILLKPVNADMPTLLQIKPNAQGGGLRDGLDALNDAVPLEGRQIVAATNGHYKTKDMLQADIWSRTSGVTMHYPPVAIGDEPGDSFPFQDKVIVTPARTAEAYLTEIALTGRQSLEWIRAAQPAEYSQMLCRGRTDEDGSKYVIEADGSEWLFYSSSSYLQYNGPDDYVGFYRE